MTTIPVQPYHGLSGDESGITCVCGETFTEWRDAMAHQIEKDSEIARFNDLRSALVAVIDTLNRLHAADPKVLPALIEYRVPCNRTVAADPTIQVNTTPCLTGVHDHDHYEVGFLGILNGVFGIRSGTQGHIGADYDDDGHLTGFVWTGA